MQILLINGPARSGKDTAGEIVKRLVPGVKIMKFAGPLKRATTALHYALQGPLQACDLHDINDIHRFEDCKDEPDEMWFGKSYRQALIDVSELWAKQAHDPQFFGRVMVENILRSGAFKLSNHVSKIVITDSGFTEEIKPLAEKFGGDKMWVWRVTRPGFTFEGDSRDWVSHPTQPHRELTIPNNTTLDAFEFNVRTALEQINWL